MGFDVISYVLAKKALKRALSTLTWNEIKEKLRTEGAVNKVYDPDLDGILGTVSVEALKLADNEKIYFGINNKYSLRYDPIKNAFIIRDEMTGVDVLEVV